jgi:pyruvate dehydrogenase E2 component (dihydrolipoamide acetyltransferase)
LGQTVDTVTLVSWYREEGEPVFQGENLFAIETDKAILDIEAPATGTLRRVTAQPGDEVQVLSVIALIAAPDEVLADPALPAGETSRPDTTPAVPQAGAAVPAPVRHEGERIFISPRARRLAEKHGVSLVALQATGPEGAIVERDVCAYLEAAPGPAISPVARRIAREAGLDWRTLPGSGPGGRIMRDDVTLALGEARALGEAHAFGRAQTLGEVDAPDQELVEAIPVRGVRAVIAERMLHSATSTAPVTLNAEADATALVELRGQLRQDEVEASYNGLLLYVLRRALREYPRLNASIQAETINVWKCVHVGLAVDTDRGLLVPVVRDVTRKGIAQLTAEAQALVQRARTGQCTPEELGGGTFTLTNLGMFGIDSFTPIINLPECAILGVGRIKKKPVMHGDQVVGRDMVWLSLTFDHRLVDGGPAARFLQRVVQLIERPHLLMA